MLVGVISDTHGTLDPAVHVAFDGVTHILHAGDIGGSWILEELALTAPVTAVAGNMDSVPTAGVSREPRVVELSGVRILFVHERDDATRSPHVRTVDVIVVGHTHVPEVRQIGSVLVFNPGSASQPRRASVASVGLLEIAGGRVDARIVVL